MVSIYFIYSLEFTKVTSISCVVGTYSDQFGSQLCKQCPAGTYGLVNGSDSIYLCLDCKFGTYNDETGQTQCKPCNSTDICPPGSISPSSLGFNVPSQARTFFLDISEDDRDKQSDLRLVRNIVLGAGGGGAIIVTILFIVAICVLRKSKTMAYYLMKWDLLFSMAHDVQENNPPIKKKTLMGTVWTLFALLLMAVFLACSLIDYFSLNTFYTNTIVQGTATIPNGLYQVSVSLYGVKETDCSPDIATTGFNGVNTTFLYDQGSRSCNVVWRCNMGRGCSYSNRNIAQISILLDGLSIMYYAMDYSITLPYFKNTQYIFQGQRLLPNGTIFRGEEPTTLFFSLNPQILHQITGVFAAYFRGVRTKEENGVSVHPTGVTLGSTVNSFPAGQFSQANVVFQFLQNPNTLLIQEEFSQSILNLLGQVTSLCGLVLAVMILLFGPIEHTNHKWRERHSPDNMNKNNNVSVA
jgi:hypothetical protein